jgi:hypothetical protein
MPNIEVNGGPEIEVISPNDPQFQTIFSDSATYEPPGRRQDFEADQPDSFDAQFGQVQGIDEPPVPEQTLEAAPQLPLSHETCPRMWFCRRRIVADKIAERKI